MREQTGNRLNGDLQQPSVDRRKSGDRDGDPSASSPQVGIRITSTPTHVNGFVVPPVASALRVIRAGAPASWPGTAERIGRPRVQPDPECWALRVQPVRRADEIGGPFVHEQPPPLEQVRLRAGRLDRARTTVRLRSPDRFQKAWAASIRGAASGRLPPPMSLGVHHPTDTRAPYRPCDKLGATAGRPDARAR